MVNFLCIAEMRLGKERYNGCVAAAEEGVPCKEVTDACLDAMEEGALDVCARDSHGDYFWVLRLQPRQWVRLCALLQRQGIPSSTVWHSFVFPPQFVEGVEHLWTDLDSVRVFMEEDRGYCRCGRCDFCHARHWVGTELQRRREWATALRRAWLAAT